METLTWPFPPAMAALREYRKRRNSPWIGIWQQMNAHAQKCQRCRGHMVTYGHFRRLTPENGEQLTEFPSLNQFLCALDSCFQIKVETKAYEVDGGRILPSPLANKENRDKFARLFRQHVRNSGQLIGFGTMLPCSLATREFFHSHHATSFSHLNDMQQRIACVDLYDTIGDSQISAFEHEQRNGGRRWRFTCIMLYEHLEAIAKGKGAYHNIGQEIRRTCLNTLLAKMSDSSWNIELVLVDEFPKRFRSNFKGFDSVVWLSREFLFRRSESTFELDLLTDTGVVDQYHRQLLALLNSPERRDAESDLKAWIAGMR